MVSPSAVWLVMHESRGAFIHMCVEFKAVRVNENKHSHQLQTGFVRYMILKLMEMRLVAPVTTGYFFLSAPCPSLSPFAANYLD